MADAVVQFADVTYGTDGGRPVLSHLSLEIARGETLALLGRSGSGKTTLLRHVNATLLPSAGEVRVEGRSTRAWDPIALRRRIGYVMQDAGLFPHMNVAANVGLLPRLEGWPKERVEARVRELLALVGLPGDDLARRHPRGLSGGQRQRVGVARALALDPPILLMDEPFGALDPLTRDELQRAFQELQGRLRKTVVLVTHDLREALLLGTSIAILARGSIVAEHAPASFLASDEPQVAAYRDAYATPLGA